MIGIEIGKMHTADIIHGDLTTSNMMLRRPAAPTQTDNLASENATSSPKTELVRLFNYTHQPHL